MYHIVVGGGGKRPYDASGVLLATVPVDADIPKNPARHSREGKRSFGCFLWRECSAPKTTHDVLSNRPEALKNSSEFLDRMGVGASKGCHKGPQ